MASGAELMKTIGMGLFLKMKAGSTINGFTLIELLVAMTISLLILTSVYNVYTIQNRTLSEQEQKVVMLQNARMGLDFMVREIRMAGYNPSGTLASCTGSGTTVISCVGITTAAANTISFSADLDGDGDLTPDNTNPNENITYDLYTSGGIQSLGRTSNGSKQPVVENISSLSFTYLDAGNVATPNLALIKKIRVSITAKTAIPNVNNVYGNITLSSDIVPRNLNN
jgi:type IV pilus assembly protein PilW